jgi:hypothetical protein
MMGEALGSLCGEEIKWANWVSTQDSRASSSFLKRYQPHGFSVFHAKSNRLLAVKLTPLSQLKEMAATSYTPSAATSQVSWVSERISKIPSTPSP